MRSHGDPDTTEGCQTGSPQVASNSVYGIISGASYEYQRLIMQNVFWYHQARNLECSIQNNFHFLEQ